MTNLRDKRFLEVFGKHLKKVREKAGLTQAQLANDINIEISQISRIERGLINPSLCTLENISKALSIPLSKLLDF